MSRRIAARGRGEAQGRARCRSWWRRRRSSSASTSARVDLVCHLGAPRALATLLQRVGRSGHALGAVPKGIVFPLTRDELVQAAAAVRAVRAGELDALAVPRGPRDILAQQCVAIAAAGEIGVEELFALVRRAYPYPRSRRAPTSTPCSRCSPRASRRGAAGARRTSTAIACTAGVRARRGARLAAITGGGAIPDTADYDVVEEPHGLARRQGQRGLRGREHARRHLPARQPLVAHPPRRGGPHARRGRARRAADDPVLARRGAGAHARAVGRGVAAARGGRRARGARPAVARRRSAACRPMRRGQLVALRRRGAGRARRRRADAIAPSSPSASSTRRAACSSWCTRRSAAASTARSGSRCASASASASTSSCRRPRPTTASCSRSASSTASRSTASSRMVRRATLRRRPRAGGAGGADVRQPLALERDARAGAAALRGRQEGADAAPAHARRGPAGGGVPGAARLRGQHGRRPDPDPRPSAGDRDDRQLPARGDGRRRPRRGARARSTTGAIRTVAIDTVGAVAAVARDPATRTRTPSSTTRRSRSAAPAPCRCARRSRSSPAASARSTPTAIAEVRAAGVARRARRRRAARRAALARRPAARRRSSASGWTAWADELVQRAARDVGARRRRSLVAAERVGRGAAGAPASVGFAPPVQEALFGRRAPATEEDALRAIVGGWLECARPDDGGGAGGAPRAARVARRRSGSAQLERAGAALRGRYRARARSRRGMVRPRAAGAHPPPDARPAARARSSRSARPTSCASSSAGSTCSPGRSCTAATGCSRSSASSRASSCRRARGSRRCCPRASSGYEPDDLEHLCLGGEVAWGRLRAAPPPRRRAALRAPGRAAPLAFVLREDLPWLLAPAATSRRSCRGDAQAVHELLARRGASFIADIARGTGARPGGGRGRAVDAGGARARHRRRHRRPARC